MSNCDPDRCDYAIDAPELGCAARPCPEHDPDQVVQWNDGRDSDWLHARGTCAECDRYWVDVDANTAYYAAEKACKAARWPEQHDPKCLYCASLPPVVKPAQTDRRTLTSAVGAKGSSMPKEIR